MSEEQLKGFLEAVAADAELQEKLKAATDVEAVVAIAAIAEAAGFVVSAEELEALVLQAQSEISEEELQGVAGGLFGFQGMQPRKKSPSSREIGEIGRTGEEFFLRDD